jgi:hypothetical protein
VGTGSKAASALSPRVKFQNPTLRGGSGKWILSLYNYLIIKEARHSETSRHAILIARLDNVNRDPILIPKIDMLVVILSENDENIIFPIAAIMSIFGICAAVINESSIHVIAVAYPNIILGNDAMVISNPSDGTPAQRNTTSALPMNALTKGISRNNSRIITYDTNKAAILKKCVNPFRITTFHPGQRLCSTS